ncbi:MAG: T9SS type A sorting domain-containing protein [candidate division WOR-3 bacterium]|uniref:T9SS type A sorting domain-containing protein n=1 Tax=candidate division WOR-3 bacterium TaxID=2052148 RepID=A0A7C3F2I8_UNCW3|nr:T9SS type A sorting domain-containing protein [candidate division WOR-3 bacterium]
MELTRHASPTLKVITICTFFIIYFLSAQYLEKVIPVPYRTEDNGATVEPSYLLCLPELNKLYCAGDMGWTIVLDCSSNQIIKDIPTNGPAVIYYWQRHNRIYAATAEGTAVINCYSDSILTSILPSALGVFNDSENCYLARVTFPDHSRPDNQSADGLDRQFTALLVIDGESNTVRQRLNFLGAEMAALWNSTDNRYHIFNCNGDTTCLMTVIDARTNTIIDTARFCASLPFSVEAFYLTALNKIYLCIAKEMLVIDGHSNSLITRLPAIPAQPWLIYDDLRNKLYCFPFSVSAGETAFISVINCLNDSIINRFPVPGPAFFTRPALNPTLSRLFYRSGGFLRVMDCTADTLLADSLLIPGGYVALASSPVQNRIYAAVNDRNRIYIINAENLTVIDTVTTGMYSNCDVGGVIFNPRVNKIYARNYLPGDTGRLSIISVIDGAIGRKLSHICTGVNGSYGDRGMCLHPAGEKLYVANSGSNNITIIDCRSDRIVKVIGLPSSPEYLALNTQSHKLYCTHGSAPLLSIIDCQQDSLLATIPIPLNYYAYWLTWHPQVNKVYIKDPGRLIVVDGANNQVRKIIQLDTRDLSFVTPGVANTADSRLHFLVAGIPEGAYYSVDVIADTVTAKIGQLRSCIAITWHPQTDKVYFPAWRIIPNPTPELWILNAFNDSLLKTISVTDFYGPAQTTSPISHSNYNRAYFLLKEKGLAVIDCTADTIARLIPFPVREEWGEYGMSFDTATNRIYVINPGSHIYVFRDEIPGIKNSRSLQPAAPFLLNPSPFRNRLKMTLPAQTNQVTGISIYCADGRLVRHFSPAEITSSGNVIIWNGTDDRKQPLPAGTYFIRLRTDNNTETRKIVFAR